MAKGTLKQTKIVIYTVNTKTDLTPEQTGDLVKVICIGLRHLNLGDKTIVTDPEQAERCKKIANAMIPILNDF